jgi:hypothetical protein
MGTTFSKATKEDIPIDSQSYGKNLDYISTYYILTSDFQSLQKLYDKDYCDKLVILTADIIKQHLSDMDVQYMQSRIINGEETNTMTNERMIYFVNSEIEQDNLSTITKSKNKSRMCIGIAKFYIKIAHIFAAIITTINPMYEYQDENNNEVFVAKENIPPGADVKMKKNGLCQRRLEALERGFQVIKNPEGDTITVGPSLCSFKTDTVLEEAGIPDLQKLYYDKYNYEEGNYYGMSDEARAEYESDVKKFYKIFMDTPDVPETIRSFSDIKIKSFQDMLECQGEDPVFEKSYTLTGKENDAKMKLFYDYANHIKKMTMNTDNNQAALLEYINQIFIYNVEPVTGEKRVRVNPLLTMSLLDTIVLAVRSKIITLYLTCEVDFNDGVLIYRSIGDIMAKTKVERRLEELKREESYIEKNKQELEAAVSFSPIIEPIIEPVIKPQEPSIGTFVEPSFEPSFEPLIINREFNPQFNPEVNPQFNPEVNPQFNPEVNPQFNPEVNPQFNPQFNPDLNQNANINIFVKGQSIGQPDPKNSFENLGENSEQPKEFSKIETELKSDIQPEINKLQDVTNDIGLFGENLDKNAEEKVEHLGEKVEQGFGEEFAKKPEQVLNQEVGQGFVQNFSQNFAQNFGQDFQPKAPTMATPPIIPIQNPSIVPSIETAIEQTIEPAIENNLEKTMEPVIEENVETSLKPFENIPITTPTTLGPATISQQPLPSFLSFPQVSQSHLLQNQAGLNSSLPTKNGMDKSEIDNMLKKYI